MGAAGGWWRSLAALVLLMTLYFVAPFGRDDPLPIAGALVLSLGCVALLGWVITRQVTQHFRGEGGVGLHSLLLLLWLVISLFATAFFHLDRVDDDQVVGIETRLDSLYFVLSTLASVGYGDVHAVGQPARGLVSVQIVFNLVFVAALVRIVASVAQARRRSGPESTPRPS